VRKVVATIAGALLASLLLSSLSGAELAQKGKLRVAFAGEIAPKRLPRQGAASISVEVGGQVSTTDRSEPPQLRRIEIAINKAGRFDYKGLRACRLEDIQPATTENALEACGASKVGTGSFSANVSIPGQTPFPSKGKTIAYYGTDQGHPTIFAHVYGTEPVPTSFTLPLHMTKAKGTFSTILSTSLPEVTGKAGFITGIELNLHRTFTYRGKRHSFLSAGCPAPKGFTKAVFPLARVSFGFAEGRTLGSVLTRDCKVRG
jgi:hypothetical protein